MSYKDIRPGKYKARAKQAQITESKTKKTPCIAVLYEFTIDIPQGQGKEPIKSVEEMWWTGWLTNTVGRDGKTPAERTWDVLAFSGLNENMEIPKDGAISEKFFDPKAEVNITIGEEIVKKKDPITQEETEVLDEHGNVKKSMKIQFVNRPSGAGFSAMEPEVVANILSGVNVREQMLLAKQRLGMKASAPAIPNMAPKKQPAPEPSFDPGEEVPF